MGITIEGPDVNGSRIAYHAHQNTLTIGFMAISNLSEKAMRAIIDERRRAGAYASLTEFARRVALTREDLAALAGSGAFDSLAPALRRSEQLRVLFTTTHRRQVSEQGELFTTASPSPIPTPALPQQRAKRTVSELEDEYASLGFLRDHHPLVLFSEALSHTRRILASHIPRYVDRHVTLVGHQITRKQVRTKGGDLMSFVSFEDETALYETVLFPDLYERYFPLLYRAAPLLVHGVVKDDHGALIIEVEHLTLLESCTATKEMRHSQRRYPYERIPTTCL